MNCSSASRRFAATRRRNCWSRLPVTSHARSCNTTRKSRRNCNASVSRRWRSVPRSAIPQPTKWPTICGTSWPDRRCTPAVATPAAAATPSHDTATATPVDTPVGSAAASRRRSVPSPTVSPSRLSPRACGRSTRMTRTSSWSCCRVPATVTGCPTRSASGKRGSKRWTRTRRSRWASCTDPPAAASRRW